MTPVASAVVDAVTSAYYTEALKGPEAARARAQNGWTISSAVAGALVAAGAITGTSQERGWVLDVGVVALTVWLIAAALYTAAAAVPVRQSAGGVAEDGESFVTTALAAARTERQAIDRRLTRAYVASSIAAAITIAVLCGRRADFKST
jgi:hypothetical protein